MSIPPAESMFNASASVPSASKCNESLPAANKRPPATASILIASSSVPPVFIIEIFSLAAVPWGENTIWTAPVLPNFNVFSFDNEGAIRISPAVASILTASIPVPAAVMLIDESFAPICWIVKSSPSVLDVIVKFISSAPSIEIVEVLSIVIAPEASISKAAESISIATSVSVPILIEVPNKLRAPAESIVIGFPAKVAPVVPSWVIVKSLPTPIANTELSDVNLKSSKTLTSPSSSNLNTSVPSNCLKTKSSPSTISLAITSPEVPSKSHKSWLTPQSLKKIFPAWVSKITSVEAFTT